jgi:hypothetical protein
VYLHQKRSYYPRVWRECTLNRCQLMPYKRRYEPQPIGGGVGGAGPRPLCMTGSTYSSTTSLRPIPAIIWQRLAPTEGRYAPGLRAIGPVLVEI